MLKENPTEFKTVPSDSKICTGPNKHFQTSSWYKTFIKQPLLPLFWTEAFNEITTKHFHIFKSDLFQNIKLLHVQMNLLLKSDIILWYWISPNLDCLEPAKINMIVGPRSDFNYFFIFFQNEKNAILILKFHRLGIFHREFLISLVVRSWWKGSFFRCCSPHYKQNQFRRYLVVRLLCLNKLKRNQSWCTDMCVYLCSRNVPGAWPAPPHIRWLTESE